MYEFFFGMSYEVSKFTNGTSFSIFTLIKHEPSNYFGYIYCTFLKNHFFILFYWFFPIFSFKCITQPFFSLQKRKKMFAMKFCGSFYHFCKFLYSPQKNWKSAIWHFLFGERYNWRKKIVSIWNLDSMQPIQCSTRQHFHFWKKYNFWYPKNSPKKNSSIHPKCLYVSCRYKLLYTNCDSQ